MKPLQPVLQHGAILLLENVEADLDREVGSDPEDASAGGFAARAARTMARAAPRGVLAQRLEERRTAPVLEGGRRGDPLVAPVACPFHPDRRMPWSRIATRQQLRRLAWGAAVLAGCASGGGEQARRDPVPVAVAAVVQRDVPVELRAIGTVTPIATVAVKSQVEGQLAEVRFEEGQEVRRDDLLFVIDTPPFEAAVREAEAKLAQDRAEAANAATEAGRFARLISSGIVSPDEYEQVRTKAAALAAAAQADEAGLETAKIQLRYCSIHSPIDGRIGKLLVHRGNVVKARDTTLAVVNQIEPVDVAFTVPQQELTAIRHYLAAGPLPVHATPPGEGARPAQGDLRFVDNAVDQATGTVLLKARFPNQDELLWPGQFVNVTLRLTTEPGALVVPARAIQTGQAGAFVYLVGPDRTVEARAVVTGRDLGEDVTVASGLAAGDPVVTDGQLRLIPGMTVEPHTEGLAAQHSP